MWWNIPEQLHSQHSSSREQFSPAWLGHWQQLHISHHHNQIVLLSMLTTACLPPITVIRGEKGKQRKYHNDSKVGRTKTYRIEPTSIRFAPWKTNSPLPPISTNGVFPFWLDFFFEAMKVCSNSQLARMVYVVMNSASQVKEMLLQRARLNRQKHHLMTSENDIEIDIMQISFHWLE